MRVPFCCTALVCNGGSHGSQTARRIFALGLLFSPAGLHLAEACSCYDNPPCSAVWKADAVFVGTVVEEVQEALGGTISWTVHNIAVNQRLHGSVEPFLTLLPAASRPTDEEIERSRSVGTRLGRMSTCDYDFEVGRQYVIYARKTADGRWTTSMCTGTKPVERARADFEYIAGIPSAAPWGRVYGSIERMIANSPDPAEQPVMPAAGVRVELASASYRLTVITDREGKLDVRVPPGDYTVAPMVPDTIRVYGALFQVSVHARGCAPVQFGLISIGERR